MGSASVSTAWFGSWGSALGGKVGPEYHVDVTYGSGGVISYYDVQDLGVNWAVYKVDIEPAEDELLDAVTMRFKLGMGRQLPQTDYHNMQHYATVTCRLYDFDPSEDEIAPYGAIASVTKSVYMTPYSPSMGYPGTEAVFEFPAHDRTGPLYVRVDLQNVMPCYYYYGYGYYVESDQVAYSGVTATFRKQELVLSIAEPLVYTAGTLNLSVSNHAGNPLRLSLQHDPGTGYAEFKYFTFTGETGNPRSIQITADKTWFGMAGVNTPRMTVKAVLTESIQEDPRTSEPCYFTLAAGEDMRPQIGEPVITLVQTGRAADYADYASTWIAGFSKATIYVPVTFPTGALSPEVILQAPGGSVTMTYNATANRFEATTPAALPGNTTLTVTATDDMGLNSKRQIPIENVLPYSAPVIYLQAFERCDQNGTANDGGEYFRINVSVDIDSDITGNVVQLLEARYNGITSTLTPDTTSILYGLLNHDAAYTVTVATQDRLSGVITRDFRLTGAHHDFMLMHDTLGNLTLTHLGVGMAPVLSGIDGVSNDFDTIQLPADAEIIIGGARLRLKYANGHTHLGIGMVPSTYNKNYDSIQLPSGGKILIGGTEKLS